MKKILKSPCARKWDIGERMLVYCRIKRQRREWRDRRAQKILQKKKEWRKTVLSEAKVDRRLNYWLFVFDPYKFKQGMISSAGAKGFRASIYS